MNTHPTLTTEFPVEDANWAHIGTAAWIAEHGGTDVTGDHGEPNDCWSWVGDVQRDGSVWRLTHDRRSGLIIAVEILTISIMEPADAEPGMWHSTVIDGEFVVGPVAFDDLDELLAEIEATDSSVAITRTVGSRTAVLAKLNVTVDTWQSIIDAIEGR